MVGSNTGHLETDKNMHRHYSHHTRNTMEKKNISSVDSDTNLVGDSLLTLDRLIKFSASASCSGTAAAPVHDAAAAAAAAAFCWCPRSKNQSHHCFKSEGAEE